MHPAYRTNRLLLMGIVVVDMLAYTLIFPLLPTIIDFYTKVAQEGRSDPWLLPAISYLASVLPAERRHEVMVILGGLISSLFAMTQFLSAARWGRLSDRVGRRPVMLFTSGGIILAAVLWISASSAWLFVLSRLVSGMAAGNTAVAFAAMSDMTSKEERTRAISHLGAAQGLGGLFGPVIGALLLRADLSAVPLLGSLRAMSHPFFLCAFMSMLLSLASFISYVVLFRETRPAKPEAGSQPVASKQELFATIPGFRVVAFANLVFYLIYISVEFFMPFFFKLDFGAGPTLIGLLFLHLGVCSIIGQGFVVPLLVGKLRESGIIIVGLLLTALPLVALPYVAPSVPAALVFLAPLAMGISFVIPALNGLGSLLCPPDRRGAAMGAFQSASSLGSAFGPMVGAGLYWSLGNRWATALLALILTALASLIYRSRVGSSIAATTAPASAGASEHASAPVKDGAA